MIDVQQRPFRLDDVPRIHELVSRWWASIDRRAQMHIGEMYWALRGGHDITSDAWVWARADGSLAAFGWLDGPDHDDVIVDDGSDAPTLDDALSWLEERAREQGRPEIGIIALSEDGARAYALESRGYVRSKSGNTRLFRQFEDAPETSTVPKGYSLGHVGCDQDVERRVFVENEAFGAHVGAGEWGQIARLPGYRMELDLLAVGPDGAGASAATCWYDEATRCGEFEAVGTVTAHRRRGLGKAVINEGLRRLHTLGATSAVVQTTIGNEAAVALYRSCGFEIVGDDYAWIKTL